MKARIIITLLGLWTTIAEARLTRSWSYPDLAAKADLVVIVIPTKTTVSNKKEALPDISSGGGKLMAARVATQLKVVVALKGTAGETIVLHHDALDGASAMPNGPGLITFDPKTKKQYLMFLVKDRDGEYVPVSGQTDPTYSIEELHIPTG